MGLIDDLKNPILYGGHQGPACTVCALLEALEAKERSALESALADKRVQHAALSRVLAKHGHDGVKPVAISRHRRSECRGTR